MAPDTSTGVGPPDDLLGIGNAGVWAPNSATATRNLWLDLAGAGAGVYNATRQLAPCSARPGWPC